MAISKYQAKARSTQSGPATTEIAAVESPNSLSPNQDQPAEDTVNLPMGEDPSDIPHEDRSLVILPPSGSPPKGQSTVEVQMEDQQPAGGCTTSFGTGESSGDQSTSAAEDPPSTPPAGENISDSPLGAETSVTPALAISSQDCSAVEVSTISEPMASSTQDQPAMEISKVPEHPTESSSQDHTAVEIPKTSKQPTESPSQEQSSSRGPSTGRTSVEHLPILTPNADVPSSPKMFSAIQSQDVPMAGSDQKPQNTALEDVNVTKINDQSVILSSGNCSATGVTVTPVPETDLPMSPPSSDTDRKFSKCSKHKLDQRTRNLEVSRKRVISEAAGNSLVYIDSEDDEIEILCASPTNTPSKASQASVSTVHGNSNGEFKSPKRTKMTTPDSQEDPARNLEGEPRSQRKTRTHRKFSRRDHSKYIAEETKWYETISASCNDLKNLITEQTQHIASLEALNVECCGIVLDLSVDSIPRTKRMQIWKKLADLEEERRKLTAELRQGAFLTINGGSSIKRDLESWYAKEKKVTERIEKSR